MQLAYFYRILPRFVELLLYMRGEDGVHKSNPRYADYIKRQNRARDRRRSKKLKHQKRGCRLYAISNQHMPVLDSASGKTDNQSVYVSKPPANFSIINNSDEVIDYFSTLIEFLKINTNARCLRFDFSAVREMTIDALMYLMAIIKFIRKEFCKVEEFSGNIPVDKEAKELLERINKANPHFIKFFKGTIKRNEDIPDGHYSKGDSSEVIMYFEQYDFLVMTLPSIHEFVLENSKKSKK